MGAGRRDKVQEGISGVGIGLSRRVAPMVGLAAVSGVQECTAPPDEKCRSRGRCVTGRW